MTSRLAPPRTLSIILVALLTAGAGVLAAGPALAATAVTAPAAVVYGDDASVTTTGTAGQVAVVEYETDGDFRASSVRSTIPASGKVTLTWRPSSTRTYRVSVGSDTTSEFTVLVISRAVVVTAKSSVTAGTATTAAVVTSVKDGTRAVVQYLSGSSWKSSSVGASVKDGKATMTWTPSSTRTYRIYVGGAVSKTFTTSVTAAKLLVSAPGSVVSGQKVTATATFAGNSGALVAVEYLSGSTWKRSSVTARISGSTAKLSWTPSSKRTYRLVSGGTRSSSFTVSITAASISVSAPKSVTAGQLATVTTKVSPATACTTATVQYLRGSTWATSSVKSTLKSGSATLSWRPSSTRTYRVSCGSLVSKAFSVTVNAAVPASFSITGSGWGHGVGMSQYGAYGMAKAGSTETEILTHYYTGTSVETVPVDQDIRVQVFGSGSDNRNSVDVVVRSPGSDATDDGQWRMQFYDAGESSAHTTWYGINNDDLMVTRSGGTVTVKREDGRTESATGVISLHWESTSFYQPTSNEDAYVELLSKEGGSALTHGQYRHGRLLISSINSRINIVNTLDLNTEYLYGIAEMPSSWSAEALQAQAIAARGYAVRNLGLSSACDCDLYDDPRSQNFSGWKKEDEGTNAYYGKRWVAAVNATNSSSGASGKVLTYGSGGVGNIVRTYYFSSSGGQTENSEDIWVSKLSYLRSVSDPWSVSSTVNNPNASWSDSISQARAESLFGLDDIVSIAVATRTGSSSKAAALTLKATSLSGATATITGGDKIRIGLGVKSPWVWTITPS